MWGLKPKLTYFLYTTVVRPIVTYACQCWWQKANQATVIKKLQGLQRSVCLDISGAFHTTPTLAMEVLLGLTPLDILIQGEAQKAAYRLVNMEQDIPFIWFERGHSSIIREIKQDTVMSRPSDLMTPSFNFVLPYKTIIPTERDWTESHHTLLRGDSIWYTDGSKHEDGTGAGVFSDNPQCRMHMKLGDENSVFQAEVFAIQMCVNELLHWKQKNKEILILSDSQAAIKALNSNRITSRLVWRCTKSLARLGKENKVKIMWIPGHKGYTGNEQADSLAKKGASDKGLGPLPNVAIPFSAVKLDIHYWMTEQMNSRWSSTTGLRHSKKFIPGHNRSTAEKLLKLSRRNLRTVVGVLTGHFGLRDHLHKMKLTAVSTCRFCKEVPETMEHVICNCVALHRKRRMNLGRAEISAREAYTKDAALIIDFIEGVGLSGV